MTDSREKGSELERRIAEFLRTHGYAVSTNVVREGRSGARHELDVVAEKHDGLTSFQLVVECKAWESPIDKDVVYKLASELSDLGAAKGVIAALSGWTVQAAQAADQAHIEMWGPEELTSRFGALSMNQLHNGPGQLAATGLLFKTEKESALDFFLRKARGTLGVGKEEITSFGPLWLPAHSMRMGITRNAGVLRMTPRVTQVWNGYDALGSNCVFKSTSPPSFVDVNLTGGAIEPRLKAHEVVALLNSKISKWSQTAKPEVKKQLAASLAQSGISAPLTNLEVEASTLVYLPLWVAMLNRRGQERIVAVDGVTGIENRQLSETLTKNAQRVRNAFNH